MTEYNQFVILPMKEKMNDNFPPEIREIVDEINEINPSDPPEDKGSNLRKELKK